MEIIMPSFNEHFIENMIGKTISFDVQPYEHGTGVIQSMKPRMIKTNKFDRHYGNTNVEYEVFDINVLLEQGTKIGALYCGVPVQGSVKDTAGKTSTINGVTYGEVCDAVQKGRCIIQARCG